MGNPVDHGVATALVLLNLTRLPVAAHFDKDEFWIFALRQRTKAREREQGRELEERA
jgi:hypothetical protein